MYLETFYSTDQIINHSRGRTHFFDADSKRFFRSRIGYNAYPTANPFVTLFVTSEQYAPLYGHPDPRKYSVRSYDMRTHDINTVGEFQQYNSSDAANKAARTLARDWEFPLEDQEAYAHLLNEQYDIERRRALHRGDTTFYLRDVNTATNYIAV